MTTKYCDRKTAYRKGYYMVVRELMNVYKDWELDPMCDCCPAQNVWLSSGKWRIEIRRVYVENDEYCFNGKWKPNNTIWTDGTPFAMIDDMPKEVVDALWDKLTAENIPMLKAKAMFEDAKLTAEVERLIP